jgi:deoxycytidine triphosphate deaminase
MLINPRTAIEQGWITFPSWMTEEEKEECVQQNAMDITLDHLYRFNTNSYFVLTKSKKQMRETLPVAPIVIDGEEVFPISGDMDFMSDFYINLPEGVAVEIIVRSTFNRNGIFITTGLYDQGYQNYIGGIIRNNGPIAYVAPGSRLAQIKFIKAESSGKMYNGSYQGTQQDPIVEESIVVEDVSEQNKEPKKVTKIKGDSK